MNTENKVSRKFKIITAAILVILFAFIFLYGGGYLHESTPPDSYTSDYTSKTFSDMPSSVSDMHIISALILENVEKTDWSRTSAGGSSNSSEAASDNSSIDENSDINAENLPDQTEQAEQNGNGEPSSSPSANGETKTPAASPSMNSSSTDASSESSGDKGNNSLTCTISINCSTPLNHMSELSEEVKRVIPGNGWIMSPVSVSFKNGDTVFDVLKQITREKGIHLEFVNTAVYDSIYIEGIGNLYEFDCGELSGWSYRVNGTFPSYSSSKYVLSSGDTIEWLYTCDLGKDIGGNNVTG